MRERTRSLRCLCTVIVDRSTSGRRNPTHLGPGRTTTNDLVRLPEDTNPLCPRERRAAWEPGQRVRRWLPPGDNGSREREGSKEKSARVWISRGASTVHALPLWSFENQLCVIFVAMEVRLRQRRRGGQLRLVERNGIVVAAK